MVTNSNSASDQELHCGFVAIVGRPNVGKSTLLNQILGQKLSITSKKPQTTRHQILGIKTEATTQAVYVDTPGLHLANKKALNRYMNKAAITALQGVDVVVFVVDRTAWTDEDQLVLDKVCNLRCPVILAVNKVDQLKDKSALLPHISLLSEKMTFADIVPISAETGLNVDRLELLVGDYLPKSHHFYDEDQITDRSSRFLAAEIVREKVMRQLGDEIPYQITVEIEQFQVEPKLITVSALILVEKAGQKAIVIGKKGEQIKVIGRDARIDMEKLFDNKVMLNLWVKVKSGWSDDERALNSLGYTTD
ncbi:GTPase Era [Spartinivicinus marinus]|uniref:GTPase Era n=1 Tax=Spartinivicinus marinus TaxID=2994442 RepID=UPI002255E625|nr:GTPase Era [Spartinivicinus marinus]